MSDQSGEQAPRDQIMRMAAEVVAAYLGRNSVATAQIAEIIETVFASLRRAGGLGNGRGESLRPAVPIKKSVTPDYLICLEDGKKLKMLKRHLKTSYNLTPEQYRERWGLAPDYPMVAPNYAKQRSKLAKDIGLGTRGRRARAG